ncbi:MAG: hypothetical protein ACYC5F_09495 [Thermoleophilia bacterium]
MKMRIKGLAALSSSLKSGLFTHPLATIVAAGLISLLTLAASLYLFIFAGQGLLPPPPLASLPVTRMLEPVPVGAGSASVGENPGNGTAIPGNGTAESPATVTATAPLGLAVTTFVAAAPATVTPTATPATPVVVASVPAAPTISDIEGDGNNEEEDAGRDQSNKHASVASNAGRHSDNRLAPGHFNAAHKNWTDRKEKED